MILDTPEDIIFALTTQHEIKVEASGPYYFYKVGKVRENTAIAVLATNYDNFGFRYFNNLVTPWDSDLKFTASDPRMAVECAIRAGRTVYRVDTFYEIVEICDSEEFQNS